VTTWYFHRFFSGVPEKDVGVGAIYYADPDLAIPGGGCCDGAVWRQGDCDDLAEAE
jgi:hypothetical protein